MSANGRRGFSAVKSMHAFLIRVRNFSPSFLRSLAGFLRGNPMAGDWSNKGCAHLCGLLASRACQTSVLPWSYTAHRLKESEVKK